MFGDVGQIYDPWVFLSYVAAHTERIALGTGSVITSFRHPLDVAKFASSVDLISDSRLLFGAATGDRPIEFTAYRKDRARSEEHTSELQSRGHLVCRLLLEKKKKHIHV